MRLVTSISEMQTLGRHLRRQDRIITLVPTMGALHEGHLSLMRRAQAEGDALIVSIFVNPAQFGPSEDYTCYPRNFERDLELLQPLALEAVFAPAEAEMYPAGFGTRVEPPPLAAQLEGAARPRHFRGVGTVVLKLLNIVSPHLAYFGQKDFQQAVVIRLMTDDFNLDTRIVVCPTVREKDGLALSSRNAYLVAEDRCAATTLYRSLRCAQGLYQSGEARASVLLRAMRAVLEGELRAKPDYVALVKASTMESVECVAPGTLVLVAARIGSARLIDNLILGPAGASDEKLLELAWGESALEHEVA
ncbi:MAG TPA: pantoate--beta-alanine ligase [Terriglobia bacterium]